MDFELISDFEPTGDQPQAIEQLTKGVVKGVKNQILLGVTGSGKTFTMANVIAQSKRPTLVFSHNKTLAAQLYGEFKQFFPRNAVEYFVSYYDYYQPEAYLPTTDTYIEKDLSINDEIEKLRLSTTSALLSGRRDIVVVSSVSCIYGIGNPVEFEKNVIPLQKGQKISRNKLLNLLVTSLYSRTEGDFSRGNFRVKGDTVDIFLAYADYALRVQFFGNEIEFMETFEASTGRRIEGVDSIRVYPANIFVTSPDTLNRSIEQIQKDLATQVAYLESVGKAEEANRLQKRVNYDVEMMRELGYCSGIENYSRYFDGRLPGARPFCLLDYFPKDYLLIIDESHVTVPQVRGMYGGDRSRKETLVDYGFRLPAALDNRPLKFDEFEALENQTIYLSATPAEFELQRCEGIVVEQLIRPTGLLDPIIEVRPTLNQIDDLLEEIHKNVEKDERVIVTTLTKRMAEELTKYLSKVGIRCRYIHSEVITLERVEILRDLRLGLFDVLIGVNLLREGIDLPEVSLLAILDADKEGFLRSDRSLTQIVGRVARNENGRVIMYGDKITGSMQRTIDETLRRRKKQIQYNFEHHITPKTIFKSKEAIMESSSVIDGSKGRATAAQKIYLENKNAAPSMAAEPTASYSDTALEDKIKRLKKQIEKAAKELDFLEAARLKNELLPLQKALDERNKK
ncbi:MAG TPA: excinuclease ABC subunit UvrB [Bacteroidia bacterium]|jgi:excinuclease ABC subunit B|nr:excinuclease ABC subunit UvrB [Bacteroidia bacterium]